MELSSSIIMSESDIFFDVGFTDDVWESCRWDKRYILTFRGKFVSLAVANTLLIQVKLIMSQNSNTR